MRKASLDRRHCVTAKLCGGWTMTAELLFHSQGVIKEHTFGVDLRSHWKTHSCKAITRRKAIELAR